MLRLTALYLYPVKSCRGLAVASAAVDAHGIVADRNAGIQPHSSGFFCLPTLQVTLVESSKNTKPELIP
jgi:uncharacterized protein YcbX